LRPGEAKVTLGFFMASAAHLKFPASQAGSPLVGLHVMQGFVLVGFAPIIG
jgi:hypothetical protein